MKTLRKLIVLAGIIVIGVYLWPEPEPVVRIVDPAAERQTNSGPVIGASDADDTYAWLGIPFAAPPVGELRWRAPQAVEPWQQPMETTSFRDACVQLAGPLDGLSDAENGTVVGSEDCLYLNIWSPRTHSGANAEKLPVMFWIHGGGNSIGTANTYPGNHLAGGEQVVVVTINYRLGLLGWMSHPALRGPGRDALDSSGNFGNLDMIAALEWVRDNIARFGGDPNNVTIFGESAGGRNVYALMASPLAKDLFHRVIAQSGSLRTVPLWRAENFTDDEQPGEALSSREWLAKQLQYAGKAEDRDAAKAVQLLMTREEVRDFMYARTPEQILEGISAGAGMYQAPQGMRDGTVLPTETLYQLFADPDKYNSVPLMTGTNRDEMKLFLAQSPEFVERRFGFMPRIKNPAAYNAVASYLSDNWKALAVDGVADIIAAHSDQPVYAYRWDWDEGGKNFIVDYAELIGAGHGLEVAYIFNDFGDGIVVPGLYNDENIPGRDLLAAQMRSYWTEFARTGNPGQGRNNELPAWLRWNNGGPRLMILDTEAGGGLRMADEPMTVAMLKQRVSNDPNFPDLRTRCTMFAQLFLKANAGDDVWDEAEFEELGCSEFDPWKLEPGS